MNDEEISRYKKEIENLDYALKLRLRSCVIYFSCDLCPFGYEVEGDEAYRCRLSDASRHMLGYIIDEDVEVME